MIDKNKYPHFIPDKPTGKDVFEGQSQTHLSDRIYEHIKSIDAVPDSSDGIHIPRIIGIEGTWGSGKSNVVKKVDSKLSKENYYMFTYDAWGHQEDLQRRSILETLTNTLINDKILNGEVSIPMRNGVNHKAKWKKQLSLLLSNKTITTRKSIPKLSWAGVWATIILIVFTFFSTISGQLIIESGDFGKYWWMNTIPIGITILVVLVYLVKDKGPENIVQLLDSSSKETVDEEYTSSEEPSVMEFKNWIGAISKHLGTTKQKKNKVIIVFDNMDRLPSKKVMQLWSAIYTFFAGSEFENIWTIIPYDYIHLCEAITGNAFKMTDDQDGEDKHKNDTDCIKRFINKTFPIVYNVPQPVITDYRKLFNVFFEKAFGKTEHDQEHICQVFMRLMINPNPRTVISFVNELVSFRLQWPGEKYRLQNLALYILEKDKLLYNGISLDENLLSDSIFNAVSPFYPEKDEVRTQLCQFAYGLEDDVLAGELPLRRSLQQAIKNGISIEEHIENPNFIRILEDVLSKEVDELSLDNAVKSLASLDNCKLSNEVLEQINKKWDMLANIKKEISCYELKFDDTFAILINHASEKRISKMTKKFCTTMQLCKIENGADYFNTLHAMKECLEKAKKTSDIKTLLNIISTTPQHFAEYVVVARKDYDYYKLRVDNSELNDYLLSIIEEGKEESITIMNHIYNDKSYDFSSLRNRLAQDVKADLITKNVRIAAYINRLLDDSKQIINNRFSASAVVRIIQILREVSSEEIMKSGNEDIYAMYLADGNDVENFETKMIPRLANCFEKYFEYSDLLKQLGTSDSAFRLLNTYIIKNKKGRNLDLKYAAQNIIEIKTSLNLDYNVVFSHFNEWEDEEWNDSDIDSYSTYLKQELFEEYKKFPGHFTNSIISLGVRAIAKQPEGFLLANTGRRNNDYWRSFILSYLGTSYIPNMNINLTRELTLLLQTVCDDRSANPEDEILRKLIESEPDTAILKEYLHNKLNNYFTKINVSIVVFRVFGNLLPMLGISMDDNTARGLISNLIKPIYYNPECAKIIVENSNFYFNILSYDKSLAQEIVNGMKTREEVREIYSVVNDQLLNLTIEEEAEEVTSN